MNTPQPLQLLDPTSSTYTYLLWDDDTREAIIIDPVDAQVQRDLAAINERGLLLRTIVETHAHADHITSAAQLIEHTGAQAATPADCGIKPSAIQLHDGDTLRFGRHVLTAMHTPGHTAGSMCYRVGEHLFTGDTLLIGGCGRTDFQSGSAAALYHSITQRLFTLPDSTLVWPGHDYKGQTHSSIGHEKRHNARLTLHGQTRSQDEFVALMSQLQLPRPRRIDEAVPANLSLGVRHEAGAALQEPRMAAADAGYAGDVSPQLAYQWWQSGHAHLLDIRTDAERAWVGFIDGIASIEWKHWPGMAITASFDEKLTAALPAGSRVVFMCRSGIRSIPAAQRAQQLGYEAYNMLEGFEGDPDARAHRNTRGGWRYHGLPWRQN